MVRVDACGSYRREDSQMKDIDILITRSDNGSTKKLLLDLVEALEAEGVIVQQLKEIRETGSSGF